MKSLLLKTSFILAFWVCMPLEISAQSFSEGFEDLASLTDWYIQNNSVSPSQDWGAGDNTVFPAQAGSTSSYLSVNYQSSSSVTATTLSNWLFTPTRTYNNGDVITFYSRTVSGTPVYPDRLEVRFSGAGNGLDCGTTATSVGTFTNLLLTINPTLSSTGYPQVWTQYTITISGLTGPTNGRIAFRYYVTNGGPGGANSNYIGIDSYTYTSVIPMPQNDNCSGAISLVQGATCSPVSGTVAYASESLTGCSGTANNDVWYSFVANSTGASITVNGSPFFDAVYEVYSGSCANLTSLACVDAGFEGETESNVLNGLFPGSTYYIRVHDWLDDIPNTMTFGICVEQFTQCNLNQPIGSINETESCGGDLNGGCSAGSPVFQTLTCGDTIFGNAWALNGNRDLDWFNFQLNVGGNVTWSATAEFPFNLYIVDIFNCASPNILATSNFNACQTGSITYPLLAQGQYAAVIAPSTFDNYPCGINSSYIASLALPNSGVNINASSTAFCAGDSVTLSAVGGTNYLWYFGDSLVNSNTSWTTNLVGSYQVQYLDSNGCNGISDPVVLSQLPLDNANFYYSSATVCAGSSNLLPSFNSTGFFTAAPIGLVIDSLTGEIQVNNSQVGSYIITFQTNENCSNTSTYNFSITDSLASSFHYDSTFYCNSISSVPVMIEPNSSSGVFNSSFGLSIDANTGVIFPSQSTNGSYWVVNTVSGTAICIGSTDSMLITIQGPIVQLQSPLVACAGSDQVALQASPSGGTFSGSGVVGNYWTPSIVADSSTITYFIQDSTGCAASDSLLAITISNPIVTLNEISSLCDTIQNYQLINYSPMGGVFTGAGISSSGAINPSDLGIGSYQFNYSYTSNEGCVGSDSIIVSIVDCTLGIEETINLKVSVFPNPNQGEFYVTAENIKVVNCWNLDGRKINCSISQIDSSTILINLSQPSGIYLVEIMQMDKHFYVPVTLF